MTTRKIGFVLGTVFAVACGNWGGTAAGTSQDPGTSRLESPTAQLASGPVNRTYIAMGQQFMWPGR